MSRHLISRLFVAAVAALVLGLSAGAASAQQRYATGGTPTPDNLRQSAPEVPVYRDFLPEAVDLSRYFPPVGDQMQQGSCVGWATAYAARAYYAMQIEQRDNTQPQNIPSPAWVFNLISLSTNCDGGSYIYDALNVLKEGAVSLADYPYDDTKCAAPSTAARSKAGDFKIEDFELVFALDPENQNLPLKPESVDQTKGELAQGHPVVIIAFLDNSFFDISNQPGHQVWNARIKDQNVGGHAFTLVGYDDKAQVFKFINSWNTGWGTDGYGFMSYDTFRERAAEGWVMTMPGDPEVTLEDADFHNADIDEAPPPKPPSPHDLIKPHLDSPDMVRALGDEAIDFGDLNCGAVEIGADADGNPVATGFVGTEAELDRVNGLLNDIESQVVVASWPKCEVMLTLQGQLADSDTPQAVVDPEAPKVGDNVAIGIKTPGFESYLYAAYFAADGSVLNLAQPGLAGLKPKGSHSALTFGTEEGNGFTVAPPVGEEMLLVVASESPLFDEARPDIETSRTFLSGLRAAVLAGDSGRVTATLVPVTTTE
jgi:hypothetical protein